MKILAIDTATPSCSVALVDDEKLLAETTVVSRQTHAAHLVRMIEQTVSTVGLKLADLDGFAVTRGPGSFTGLRIGISTIKGFSLALDRPMVGVSTLEALALQCGPTSRLICSMVDARKGEIFYGGYRLSNQGLAAVDDEQVLAPRELVRKIVPPCVAIGNGAILYHDLLVETFGSGIESGPPGHHILRASSVAELGYRRLRSGDHDEAAAFVPTYIRKSDAELKRKQ
jgi:tRNA threonylcarbamoyladenosine biosynthesis protein TsaB